MIHGKITVMKLVKVEALMLASMRPLEYREGQAGKAADVHLVWGQTYRCANGIALGKFDVQQLYIQIAMTLSGNHG